MWIKTQSARLVNLSGARMIKIEQASRVFSVRAYYGDLENPMRAGYAEAPKDSTLLAISTKEADCEKILDDIFKSMFEPEMKPMDLADYVAAENLPPERPPQF